jgi:hypothetical protein
VVVALCVKYDTLCHARAVRVEVRRQQLEDGSVTWRLTESDGELVCRWLPLEPFVGSLDRGGFAEYRDAVGFGLGVDLIRAEAGLLGELDALAIDRERAKQDGDQRGRPRALSMDMPQFVAA